MLDNTKRDKTISESILQGGSASNLARLHGISRGRCIQVLYTYCANINRAAYFDITGSIKVKPSMKQLHDNAKLFLDNNNEYTISEHSHIFKVSQFPMSIVNAFEYENIHTVGDILAMSSSELSRIPMIGMKSLQVIEDFKKHFKEQRLCSSAC